MAILCGIEASISIEKLTVTHEYKDRGQNKVLKPADRRAINKVSNFISVGESYDRHRQENFRIHCTLQPDFALDCEYLAFLLSVDGGPRSFSFFSVPSLMQTQNEKKISVIGPDDWNTRAKFQQARNWTPAAGERNFVDLRVFRMKTPTGLKTSHKIPLEGYEYGSGTDVLDILKGIKLHKDRYMLELEDNINLPFALFTWKHATQKTLQDLLIVPRPPKAPFQIATCVRRAAVVTIDDNPSFPWAGLVRGKRMLDLDRLAFESLSHSNLKKASAVKNLGIREIELLASKYCNNMDLSHLPLDEVLKHAELYVQKEVHDYVHTRTLHVLAAANFKASVSGRRALNAGTAETELAKLSDEESMDIAKEQEKCEATVENMSIEAVEDLARSHVPDEDFSKLSIFDVKKYASKGLMLKHYSEAQHLVITAIAGENLLADQENRPRPHRYQRPVEIKPEAEAEEAEADAGEPSGSGVPGEDRTARARATKRLAALGIAIPSAIASPIGEASGSGDSRRRTRSQAGDDAAADSPAKRTRAA